MPQPRPHSVSFLFRTSGNFTVKLARLASTPHFEWRLSHFTINSKATYNWPATILWGNLLQLGDRVAAVIDMVIPCNKSIQIPHTSHRGSRYNLSSRGSSVCEIMSSFKYVRLCKLSEVRRLFARFLLTSSSLLLPWDGTSSQSWAFEEGTGFLVYCGWAKYWEKVARGRSNKCVV